MGKKVKRSKEQKITLQFRKVHHKLSGLFATDQLILQELGLHGVSTASDLATRVQLTSGSMTAAINRLEKLELIRRAKSDLDRRKVYVELTPLGEDELKTGSKLQQKALKAVFGEFTDRELALMSGILKRLEKGGF